MLTLQITHARVCVPWRCTPRSCVILIGSFILAACAEVDPDRIQPYADNPFYWQYEGRPLLLLGGSKTENVFQTHGPALTQSLERLRAAGGNYLRNLMIAKYPGDVRPFLRLDNGRYDLARWNETYWERFETFLRETQQRDMVVQIELWGGFQFYAENWDVNPWNPRNNVNYSAEASGLPVSWQEPPYRADSPFVLTVSSLPFSNNQTVLPYQQRFVSKVMEISLNYDHVLYQIQNENKAPHAWSDYWAAFLHAAASNAGRQVEVTDMRGQQDVRHAENWHVIQRPNLYTFFEISQNNHQSNQLHYDRIQRIRALLRLELRSRPINNVKIYGADGGPFGNDHDGIERFWRNVFGGAASARFHRDGSGLGFSQQAQTHINSMRILTDAMNLFSTAPNNGLLEERSADEAYLLAEPGQQYALFFTGDGNRAVKLDLSDAPGELHARWLNISMSRWAGEVVLTGGGETHIEAPGKGLWVLLITRGR